MKRRTAQEQKLIDDERLMRAWRAWHREQLEEALAGPHGAVLSELFRMLANLQHVQPSQLIGFAHTIDWAVIDYATKLTVLHEVNTKITAYREQRGLDPIDDPLDERPNAFREIRKTIMSFPPPVRKPSPAPAHFRANSETVKHTR